MVAVNSTMLELGTSAPPFSLPDAHGVTHAFDDIAAGRHATLVMFICNHCPYVRHIADVLGQRSTQWMDAGVAVVAVNPNDAERYPDDSPEAMLAYAAEVGWRFPYLIDADQSVAVAYRAACTPDFFLFDADRRLVYRGQFDSARPSNDTPVTGDDLDAAITASLSGRPPTEEQIPSLGCSIKWKPEAEPEWSPTWKPSPT